MLGGMTELRDSSVMIQLAYQAMLSMGIDVNKVLSQVGVTPELLEDRNARTPHEAQLLFWRVIEEVSDDQRSEEHTSELQSRPHLVCRLLLEKKKKKKNIKTNKIKKKKKIISYHEQKNKQEKRILKNPKQ